MDQEEKINKIFKKLTGQTIKKFSVKQGIDNYFHLVTDEVDLEFGANDLGVWLVKMKNLKNKKIDRGFK